MVFLAVPVVAGPVGWWRFESAPPGAVVRDASGGGNDGRLRGNAEPAPGRVGRAARFTGREDVVVPHASRALRPASVTVAAWVKVDPDLKQPGWVAAQGDNYGLVVNRYDDDGVFFYVYDGQGWKGANSGDVAIRDGRWHHIAGVFDQRAGQLYVYKDGVRVGREAAGGSLVYKLGDEFTIGAMQGGRHFRGAIDEVRVYDRVLTQAEMETVALCEPPTDARPQSAPVKNSGPVPVGVVFQKETLRRVGDHGDNWCLTWAADDSLVTSMCDGDWLGQGQGWHNHLYRILGGPDPFQRQEIPQYPDLSGKEGSWFGYGIVSVDGILYSVISKTPSTSWSGPFRGIKLLKSPDHGRTWYRVNRRGEERRLGLKAPARNLVNQEEMFFLEEFGLPHQKQPAYPFSYLDFVQCGRDNAAARDDYLYIYSPEGAHAHKLLLARVPKDKLGVRAAWEYFVRYDDNGQLVWTRDIRRRGYAHVFPRASREGDCFGWYSWLPSVVWNEGLGLYIMVNGGTYAGHKMTASDADYYDAWMHTRTGSLGFWWSRKPCGPWHRFYYTDYWTVDNPGNRTYQPKLSPKWISPDGREMVLIWSDAMSDAEGHSHTVNYKWNQMRIELLMQ